MKTTFLILIAMKIWQHHSANKTYRQVRKKKMDRKAKQAKESLIPQKEIVIHIRAAV